MFHNVQIIVLTYRVQQIKIRCKAYFDLMYILNCNQRQSAANCREECNREDVHKLCFECAHKNSKFTAKFIISEEMQTNDTFGNANVNLLYVTKIFLIFKQQKAFIKEC